MVLQVGLGLMVFTDPGEFLEEFKQLINRHLLVLDKSLWSASHLALITAL